jgi:hypothetical protein
VFAGRVTRVEYLEPDRDRSEPPIRVTFEVDEVWKGPVRHIAVLRTIYNKWSCDGYYFKAGQEYLVAVQTVNLDDPTADRAELEGVSLCGGTQLLSRAQEDIAQLGPGKRPR